MRLAALEEAFAEAVRTRTTPAGLLPVLRPAGTLSIEQSVSIYRNGHWYRLVDALFDCLPKTTGALGEQAFAEHACAYLGAHPPAHPQLELLGHALGAFLAGRVPTSVAELASLEHARMEALLAPDPPSVAAIEEVDPSTFPSSRFVLSPTLRCLALGRGAVERWHGPDREPLDGPSVHVVAYRRGHAVEHAVLDADEAQAFALARAGAPVADVCAAFDEPAGAARALRHWFSRTWIVRLESPT